jgi:TP901 family phage tail tape measure protein
MAKTLSLLSVGIEDLLTAPLKRMSEQLTSYTKIGQTAATNTDALGKSNRNLSDTLSQATPQIKRTGAELDKMAKEVDELLKQSKELRKQGDLIGADAATAKAVKLRDEIAKQGVSIKTLKKEYYELGRQIESTYDKATRQQLQARRDSLRTQMQQMQGTSSQSSRSGLPGIGGQLRSEVAGRLGPAGALLTNPVTAGVGLAVAGIAAGYNKAADAAQALQDQIYQIRILNMDKPRAEIEALGTTINNMALKTGLAAPEIARAVYDIQSATGLYGQEAVDLATRIGQFAQATGANYSEMVNSANKAMLAFKIPASEVDRVLRSQMATVQLGVTTYEELSRVTSEFSGTAAAAGQSIDQANKLFAAFTTVTKDSNTAATAVKGAFQGMTSKQFIEQTKALGVSVFDNSGKMRQMSDIVTDLNPKLKAMSDQQFAQFAAAVGGPEGLKTFLNQVKTSGDEVISVFQKFDNTLKTSDINKILGEANNNLTIMEQQVQNKLNAAFARLGEKIMPILIKGMNVLADAIEGALNFTEKIGSAWDLLFGSPEKKKNAIETLIPGLDKVYAAQEKIALRNNALFGGILQTAGTAKRLGQLQAGAQRGSLFGMLGIGSNTDPTMATAMQEAGVTPSAASGGLPDEAKDTVRLGATQTRQVTVNINSLVQQLTVSSQTLGVAMEQVQDVVQQTLIAATNNYAASQLQST